jgi:hypothetical protein
VKNRPRPKPGWEGIPVPAGQVFYDSLKTSFVDFGRLISNLAAEAFTGYVRLVAPGAAGLVLFLDGTIIQCLHQGSDDSEVVLGKPALQQLARDVTRGDGVLDVIGLSIELVNGLYALAVSKPMYSNLYAAWVSIGALLQFLHKRRLSGSVMIRAKAGSGVIVLAGGEFAGAYTSESWDIGEPDRAMALCEDPTAVIEVKAVDLVKPSPLEFKDAITALPAPSAQQQGTTTAMQPVVLPAVPPAPAGIASNLATPPVSEEPPPQPTVSAPGRTPAPAAGSALDWVKLVAELQDMAGNALGHRARKVKELLAFADPTLTGIEAAIDQIPYLVILFVDSARMEQLAQDMRARLRPHR